MLRHFLAFFGLFRPLNVQNLVNVCECLNILMPFESFPSYLFKYKYATGNYYYVLVEYLDHNKMNKQSKSKSVLYGIADDRDLNNF